MKVSKNVLAFIVLLAAIGAGYYFFVYRKSGETAVAAVATNDQDNQAYAAALAYFKQNMDANALVWMLPEVLNKLQNRAAGALDPSGRTSKVHAFVQTYYDMYGYPPGYGYAFNINGKKMTRDQAIAANMETAYNQAVASYANEMAKFFQQYDESILEANIKAL